MTALINLILVFAGIVLLLSRKWNLGLVLVLASVAVSLLFAYPLLETARDVLRTVVDPLTLQLALTVVMIMIMGELLRQTAGLKGMVEALQALIPNGRIVIAALPALVGLLPMVGGAMFSAPLVDEMGDRLTADNERKTFINYWFRHMWEPVFPLYPAMVLAAALLGLTTIQMAKAAWPLTAAAAGGGLLFGLLGMDRHGTQDPPPGPRAQSLRQLAASTWPIALVLTLSMTLPIDEHLVLIVSALVTVALMMTVNRVPLRDLWTIMRERIPWTSVLVIFGALIFRRVLENSSAVTAISDGLTDLRIPVAVVAFGAPFIAGLLTGLLAAAHSIAFPVIIPMIVADGSTIAPAWALWLVTGGYLGILLSPVHLCLALTRVYFKAEWGGIYRRTIPSALLIAATAATILLLSG